MITVTDFTVISIDRYCFGQFQTKDADLLRLNRCRFRKVDRFRDGTRNERLRRCPSCEGGLHGG